MNLRLINSFCFFLLIVCPLTASAACPKLGTDVEIISSVNTHEFEWNPAPKGPYHATLSTIHGYCGKNLGPPGYIQDDLVISVINELPQCQPVGDLHRECVDLKTVSTFPIADGCVVNYEYTACAYSPGVMLKEGDLGIDKEGMQKQMQKKRRDLRKRGRPSARGRR